MTARTRGRHARAAALAALAVVAPASRRPPTSRSRCRARPTSTNRRAGTTTVLRAIEPLDPAGATRRTIALTISVAAHEIEMGINGVPHWKDTVDVPARSRLEIAIRFDERPGVWMYHCHILDHADAGMMGHIHV